MVRQSILLVGGFGSSEYLFTRLKEKYTSILGTASNPDVVLQPVDAWTAVVRGAVIRGMETIVQTRRSRHHYGVKYWEYFDEGRHDETHKYWDITREKWLAENQIKWYIAKVNPPPSRKPCIKVLDLVSEIAHSPRNCIGNRGLRR